MNETLATLGYYHHHHLVVVVVNVVVVIVVVDSLSNNNSISPEGYHSIAIGLKDNDSLQWLRFQL